MTTTLRLYLATFPPTDPDAPCHNAPDPLLWTSDEARDRRRAALACRPCPILLTCRDRALARRERHGVWGGLDLETEYRARYKAPRMPEVAG